MEHAARFLGAGRVVYLADQAIDGIFGLYDVAVTGGPVTAVSLPQIAGVGVTFHLTSPDGQYVVYIADHEAVQRFELFVATNESAPTPTATTGPTPTATAPPNGVSPVYVPMTVGD